MIYRKATIKDLEGVAKLQEKYHIDSIAQEDKKDGFVTTLFSHDQFKELIEKEDGLALACDGDRIVGYAMAASWEYWSDWPIFRYMIEGLEGRSYKGRELTVDNSYQYGPICIEKEYRGTSVLPDLFDFSRSLMEDRYDIMITFINQINPRSYRAHTKKLKMELLREFDFNNNKYYELAYEAKIPLK